jgi:hypothetical protein
MTNKMTLGCDPVDNGSFCGFWSNGSVSMICGYKNQKIHGLLQCFDVHQRRSSSSYNDQAITEGEKVIFYYD